MAVVRRGAWLVLALAVAACGESTHNDSPGGSSGSSGASAAGASGGNGAASGNSPTGGAGTIPLETFVGEYAKALCLLFDRCWESVTDAYEKSGQSCADYIEITLREQSLANLTAAVADGRVQYRADNARACLEAIPALSCEENLAIDLDSCEELFVGSLEVGANCTLDAECAEGMQCVVGASCPGTCGAYAAVGEACTRENGCESGLVCSIEFGEAQGICSLSAGPGESCDSARSCSTFYMCLGLDYNDPNSTGTCEARDALFSGKLDEPCALGGVPGVLCEAGLVCELGGESSGVCREPVGSGEACTLALPEPCPEGEYCRITDLVTRPLVGVCTSSPEVGESCANPGGYPVQCPMKAYCDEQSGLCESTKRLGEVCASHDACFSAACVEQKCVARLECEPEPT